MRRSILVVTMAMLMSAPVYASAMPPEKFTFEGDAAMADWVIEDGEQFTFAGVFVNRGTFTFGGDEFEDVTVDFFAFTFGPDGFSDVFGFADGDAADVEIDTEGGTFSASISADLTLQGESCTFEDVCESIGPFDVSIEVVWDEVGGRIYPSTFGGRTLSPFGFDAFMSKSQARFTSATGSIAGDVPLDLALGDTDNASVARNSDMSRFRFMNG